MSAELSLNAQAAPADDLFQLGRRHWSGGWLGGGLLTLLCLALHLPGLWALPPIDRDESRFAEASRQMLASDQWVIPRVGEKLRLNKPPLIYWLQAFSARAALPEGAVRGAAYAVDTIHAYRLPAVLGALLAAIFTWRLGVEMFARPAGLWAAVLIASCLVVMIDVRQARVDQMLLAVTTAAQWALWRLWRDRLRPSATRWRWVLLLWTAIGLGLLLKGPVTPAIVALTALTLSLFSGEWQWWRRLCPTAGVVIVALLVAPWVVLAAQEVGWERLRDVVHHEVIQRGLASKEGHWGWPGYYLTLLPGLFWPGSLALAPAAMLAWQRGVRLERNGRRRWSLRPGRAAEFFCIAWLVPGWTLFELAGTKLPHYALPMFPAIALLAGRGLLSPRRTWAPLLQREIGWLAVWGWIVLSQTLAIVAPIMLAWLGRLAFEPGLVAIVAAVVAVNQALLVATALALHRRRFVGALRASVAMTAVLHVGLLGFILPNLPTLWLSSRMTEQLQQIDPEGERPLAAAGYHEESLVFLTAGRAKRLAWREADEWFAAAPDGLLVALEEPWDPLPAAHELMRVSGFNYANGHWQTLRLLQGRAPRAEAALDEPQAR